MASEAERRFLDVLVDAFLAGYGAKGNALDFYAPERVFLDALHYAADHGAELITEIDDETEARVNAMVERAVEEHWTVHDFQEKLMADEGPFGQSRALMIARTETVIAYNSGEAERWIADGVTEVELIDGTDSDEECREANGTVVPIGWYLDHPIAHPNCRRSAIPIV